MQESSRSVMADLWKTFHLDGKSEEAKAPAVSINTVHGPVLSIVTTQPMKVADLWEQACKQKD